MYSSKITVQEKRKQKAGAGLFKGLMDFFGVLFVLMGIMFSRGFMLSGFLLVVLYFIFDTFSKKEYEYTLDGMELRISVIWGGHYRREAHVLNLQEMEVVAPSSAPMFVIVARCGTLSVFTPSPPYSMILPTPPLTLSTRSTSRMTSFADTIGGSAPVSLTSVIFG